MPEGTSGDDQVWGWAICSTSGDLGGRTGTVGDAAGKAVNRKVVGSSPSSGAISELEPDTNLMAFGYTAAIIR